MKKLTDVKHWEDVYETSDTGTRPKISTSKSKTFLRSMLGPKVMDLLKPYGDYLLWDVFYRKYLASFKNRKAIEIGSAPGTSMVRLRDEFGIIPFGVEYTEKGANLNRAVFAANDIAESNLIQADFFSDEFQNTHKERFDLVVSRGFIEHFTDAGKVIEKHLAVLKDGGLLVVMIPNLRGIYFSWTALFNPDQLPLHNLEIMKKIEFQKLFEDKELTPLYCNYYGTFNFWMFTSRQGSPMRHVIKILLIVQRVLNLMFRLLFRDKGCESAFFSPDLIYIGIKKGSIPGKPTAE